MAGSDEHRLSWNDNGEKLNNYIAELLPLGQKCFDQRATAGYDGNNEVLIDIMHNFRSIHSTLLNLQDCIMDALKPLLSPHNILNRHIELNTQITGIQRNTNMSKLQNSLHFTSLTNEQLEEIYSNKDNQNKIVNEKISQELCELFRNINLETYLKDQLHIGNQDYLRQIPVIERNFDQQRQKFILEIRSLQDKIKILERNLSVQNQVFCEVTKTNENPKKELLEKMSSPMKSNESEYEKKINILEETVSYLSKRNLELKQKLSEKNPETKIYKEDRQEIDQDARELDSFVTDNGKCSNSQQNNKSENYHGNISKEEMENEINTGGVKKKSRPIDHEELC